MSRPPLPLASVFDAVVRALTDAQAPYAFIGALPPILWGRWRATGDVDVVVLADATSWLRVEENLRLRGFTRGSAVGPSERGDPLPDMIQFWSAAPTPVPVDVFIAKLDFEREVVSRARTVDLGGAYGQVAAPDASVIYKLVAHRGKDVDDVEAMFENRRLVNDPLDWEFIDRWAEEWEITDRLAPFRARYGPPAPPKRPRRKTRRRRRR